MQINFDSTALYLTIITVLMKIERSTSIVGGRLAYCKDHPYFAHLVYESDGSTFCGGSIIHPNLILTASHCLVKDDFKVYVGIAKAEEFKFADGYKVRRKISYPSFRNGQSWFDVALVQLSKKIKFGPNIRSIALPSSLPKVGQHVAVIGFGKTSCDKQESGIVNCTKAKHLKSAKLKISDFGYRGTIKTMGKHQNICHGDSGGPLIYNGKLIGVSASIDKVTCQGGGSFAPVFMNLHWIKKHMKHI